MKREATWQSTRSKTGRESSKKSVPRLNSVCARAYCKAMPYGELSLAIGSLAPPTSRSHSIEWAESTSTEWVAASDT